MPIVNTMPPTLVQSRPPGGVSTLRQAQGSPSSTTGGVSTSSTTGVSSTTGGGLDELDHRRRLLDHDHRVVALPAILSSSMIVVRVLRSSAMASWPSMLSSHSS
jgi:hypothetical protein